MDPSPQENRSLCQHCWGSGRADEQQCAACDGKGWVLASELGQLAGESGVDVLDDAASPTGSGRSTAVTTETLCIPGSPSPSRAGTGEVLENGSTPPTESQLRRGSRKGPPAEEKTELEKLSEWSDKIKQRMAILKSESPGEQPVAEDDGSKRPGKVAPANRPKRLHRGPPATAEQFLSLLEQSELLDPERLEIARNTNDAKTLAKKLIATKVLTRWQAAQLLSGRNSFLLGKHKLINLLGGDSTGVVFLAEHVTMGRRVAVRVISESICGDSRMLERFLEEARTLAQVEHPNIIRAYNVDQARDRYFLVMEYIDGHNLEKIVGKEGPQDYHLAADYICQTAEGLHHGHENDFIHGNVKPANLLLDSSGVVKIVGLGFSGLQESGGMGGNSDNKHMLESIDYISPEYAVGSMDLDRRADIYSLGCTFYFLLTGQPPFPEGPLFEKLAKHQSAEPESIRTFRADAPDVLVEVCEKMMAKKPEDRYATALLVARQLASYLSEENGQ